MRIFRRIMLCGELNSIPEMRKLYYTATAKVTPYNDSESSGIVSNEWDATTGEGVIVYKNIITTIGVSAFERCEDLTSITIPRSVISISSSAFSECENLAAFYGKFASADNRCLIIDGVLNSFAPAGLTSYTIPDSVTLIGDDVFYSCDSLTSVTIPDSVTSIGANAFRGCTSLTSITIPNKVTSIGNNTFYDCFSLTSVTIPNSVTTIRNNVFHGCRNLKTLTIPESVTSLGMNILHGCNALFTLKCLPIVPPTLAGTLFADMYYVHEILVPSDSKKAYQSATNWSIYASVIRTL